MAHSMHTSIVEQALRRLGERLVYHCDIEILLVGGAAGMVTGVFAPIRRDDVEFVSEYLDSLDSKGTRPDQVEEARTLLESLKVHEHE